MTSAHQLGAWAAVVATIALLAAALWSWADAGRTAGRRDHRFAVDRLVIGVVAVIVVGALLGLVNLAAGERPLDALHLLYGALAVVAVPAGRALGGRARGADGAPRGRRDGWVAVAALVLLGIELRLFMTG